MKLAQFSLGIVVHDCLYEPHGLKKRVLSEGTTKKYIFQQIDITYYTFKMELTLQEGCVEKALRLPPNHWNPDIGIVRKASAENSQIDKLTAQFSPEAFLTKTENT